MHINVGPRGRVALKWLGWISLGLFSFVMGLQLTFPYERVRDKLIEGLSSRYNVQVGSVERGWMPGKMILNRVMLQSRPEKADDPVTTMVFEHITVDVNLLASLLSFGLDADIEVGTKGGGYMEGRVATDGKDLEVSVSGKSVPAASMPGLADMVGLPMSGKIDPALKLAVDNSDWRTARGFLRLVCNNCSAGDGQTKLKFKLKPGSRQSAFAQDGVTIETVFIQKLLLQVDFAKGRMTISKWELQSGDLDAKIELQVQLAKKITDSTVISGCLRYKPSEELSKRAAKTFAALMSTGAPLGPDEYYHIKLSGDLANMKRLPRVCSGEPEGGDVAGRDFGRGGVPDPGMPSGITDTATPPIAQPSGEIVTPPMPSPVPEPAADLPRSNGDDVRRAIDVQPPPPGAMPPNGTAVPPPVPPPPQPIRDEPAPAIQPETQPGETPAVEPAPAVDGASQ